MKNSFLAKGTSPASTAKLAIQAVHHSFWSAMQARGWPASDASHAAWNLIRATRSAMKGSSEARQQLGELHRGVLDDLIAMTAKAKASVRMTDPGRQGVLDDVERMLQGYRENAERSPEEEDAYAEMRREFRRVETARFEAEGMTPEQAHAAFMALPVPT